MTFFEILKFNREPMERLISLGFKPEDCRYIDLYADYVSLKNGGGKKTWVVVSLADKYHVSERKVYSIIKRFGMNCTDAAV